ncbi:hypothetical protein Tco_0618736 [Tanacetum coccineum]
MSTSSNTTFEFDVNHNGEFKLNPLTYQDGSLLNIHVFQMDFEDMVSYLKWKIPRGFTTLYYMLPPYYTLSGMKQINNDYHTNVMYDIAKVAGKLQIFVYHTQIDLSTVLIPNNGSLEESFAGVTPSNLTILTAFQDKGTSQSKPNSQGSSTTFIYKTLIIPSFLDSCFISSTVSEDKRWGCWFGAEADSETLQKRESMKKGISKNCCMDWMVVNPTHAYYMVPEHVSWQGCDPIVAITYDVNSISCRQSAILLQTSQLRNSSKPRQQATINDGRVTLQPVPGRANFFCYGIYSMVKTPTVITNNAAYQADDLDAYGFDFARPSSKQSSVVNHSETEITSDSNIILILKQGEKPSFQNPFYLKKAQQLEPKLYDGNVIKNTSAIVIPDSEETLMLAERESFKNAFKITDPWF